MFIGVLIALGGGLEWAHKQVKEGLNPAQKACAMIGLLLAVVGGVLAVAPTGCGGMPILEFIFHNGGQYICSSVNEARMLPVVFFVAIGAALGLGGIAILSTAPPKA